MSTTDTAPLALVEIHLHDDTLQTRSCRVTYAQNFRFHNGFTQDDAATGWRQCKAVSAAGLNEADIAREEAEIVEFQKAYWRDLAARHAADAVIVRGEHYVAHELGIGIGFGGRAFRVIWLSAERPGLLCNLSAQGRVPAWMRDQLPDNAASIAEVDNASSFG